MSEWKPCIKELPKTGEYVLCSINKNVDVEHRIILSSFDYSRFWYDGTITAWMSLPEPYEEKEE